ncbi:MAG: exopolysaccharide biosynthesis polyprenyl glycosylphosphotransferase [Mycobacteriales bacterium]
MTSTSADVRALLRTSPRPAREASPRAASPLGAASRAVGAKFGVAVARLVVPGLDLVGLLLAVVLAGALVPAAPGALTYVGLTCLVLLGTGAERPRINPRLGDDVAGILGRVAVPLLPAALIGNPQATVRVAVFAGALLLVGRFASYAVVRLVRRRGWITEHTLIIGAGEVGAEVATMLQQHPEYGLVPVGFLDSFDDIGLPLPILGDATDLYEVLERESVRRVIVAFGFAPDPELVRVLRACASEQVDVHVVPRFFELGVNARTPFNDDLWGIPLMRLRRAALQTAARRTKRAFDVLMVGGLLLVGSPVMAGCALAVRLSSPGPVFFRQKRVGQHGRVVEVLKFRTMRESSDSDTRWGVDQADSRVTSVGRFLRASSLDELPQLLNVLRGEMSLVGPRPERPVFAERFAMEVPRYDDRHRVPVGITGWAQVHGLRGDTPIKERARFDNSYIENWSPWQDLRIMLRTVIALVAYRGR